MNKTCDVLAFGAHPDDVELGCGGSIAKMVNQGSRVIIVDLTQGELGTRGTAEIRAKEASNAANILGVESRINLGLKDGFFKCDDESLFAVIDIIRKYRPRIVLANALHDRHPDHGKGAELVNQSCFLSGLVKIDTPDNPESYRPDAVYHYIQDYNRCPDVVIDTSDFVDIKMKAIMAFSSQFFDPSSEEPSTPISTPDFLDHVKGRDLAMGRPCGFAAGEGFEIMRPIGANSLLDLK
ncbi:MAG: bacillithiol biosynthesis deacetylase BshB1 [Crocinitomicaceae bacterium]|nr:bacillithiol biosynthesis deacetylase BshB1 [Crocinitomicaceae bacterium]